MNGWTPVCTLDALEREIGVPALVDGRAVAVFRTYDDRVFALSNWCPFARASVLSRGIIGTRGDADVVASPMHKQSFALATGVCVDDPAVAVPTHEVRVDEGPSGMVWVRDQPRS